MCGIFGFVANEKSNLNKEDIEFLMPLLIKLSERRGREASGIAVSSNGRISIYKEATGPSAMLNAPGLKEFMGSYLSFSGRSKRLIFPVAAVGNTRLVTNGSQAIPENNQPINAEHVVGVHNGIITNDTQLLSRYPDIRKESVSYSESDTRVFLGLIDKYLSETGDIAPAVMKSYKEIEGAASIALLCDNLPVVALATNTGSLYYTWAEDQGFFVFASEEFMLKQFLVKSRLQKKWTFEVVKQLKPFSGAVVRFEDISPEIFMFNQEKDNCPHISDSKKSYDILDTSSRDKELRRCTRCVLPETYPFISFDSEGVCNYCRKYQKQVFHGREALEEILARHRSKDGQPDCIVGLSGGRDSSYGLHVLKREFKMNPIAYTYDWALVTNLSRRNQAKITGRLGVEHMIRAADIHTKRRYIRKNIYAWLKRPSLGMVPIFMAGDKMFYYYGRQLRKETGINLTIFSAGQQIEQMEFKIGFCGIDQNLINNTRLYHYDFLVKMRLAMWYAKEYLLNPAYLNESLLDSAFAFYSSFINKDDYVYLYHYVPWDEKVIERTLKEEYGWEADEKYGKNQWRMGDGHTAFIDYIYHTVAGFSEFDNFRSNQIREGLLTRQEAVKLLEEDNKPRIEMLQAFSQLIGFNLEEVLLKINSIPKLYDKGKIR